MELKNAKRTAVTVEKLRPGPHHDADFIRHEVIDRLAADMASTGLVNPLTVRVARSGGEGYEVLAGRHRMLAARKLGWTTIRVEVVEATDEEALAILVGENHVRGGNAKSDVKSVIEAVQAINRVYGPVIAGAETAEKLRENFPVVLSQAELGAVQRHYRDDGFLGHGLIEALSGGAISEGDARAASTALKSQAVGMLPPAILAMEKISHVQAFVSEADRHGLDAEQRQDAAASLTKKADTDERMTSSRVRDVVSAKAEPKPKVVASVNEEFQAQKEKLLAQLNAANATIGRLRLLIKQSNDLDWNDLSREGGAAVSLIADFARKTKTLNIDAEDVEDAGLIEHQPN